jgi:hypothetical protein
MAVVVVWVGLLLALVRTRAPAPSEQPGPAPALDAAAVADDAWMGVYLHGQKVGYGHSRMTPAPGGFRFEETSYLHLAVLDQVQNVRSVIDATTSPDFALRTFSVSLDSGLGVFDVRGNVEGQTLVLRISSGAETTEERIPLSEPIYLPSSARAQLRAAPLAAGRTLTVRAFDPSSMEHHPLQMSVIGRAPLALDGTTVDAWLVRESFRGAQTSVWIDDAGRTLREEGPMEMVVQREDANRALTVGWGEDAFDLVGAIAIRVKGTIADPRNLARLDARLGGLGEMTVPNGGRQSFQDGVLHIEREAPTAATYELPYDGREWQSELHATPFLQVDNPRIVAAARAVVGDETDPRRAAETLRRWVYDQLEKRPLASVPNALQVLDARAGDCNEHAVLFAALARAVGLPARVVAGVVYADGAFLYHAWDEVWVGSGWLSVDPAFDQMPADATHVKLVEGGPEKHAALVPVIGKLSIELLPPPGSAAS